MPDPVIFQGYEWNETSSLESPAASLPWKVMYTEDPTEVDTLVNSTVPNSLGGMILKSYTKKHVGGGCWTVDTQYAGQALQLSMDSSGGTQHITQSLETISSHAVNPSTGDTATPIDYGGAIGVTKDGVEGCDIFVPQSKISITLKHLWTDLPDDYLDTIEDLADHVNDAEIVLTIGDHTKTYDQGELLYLGATLRTTSDDLVEISYNFSRSKNATDLDIGGWKDDEGETVGVMTVDKKGWEYLWVRYATVTQTSGGTPIGTTKRPIQVNIEQVYPYGDFTTLVLSPSGGEP